MYKVLIVEDEMLVRMGLKHSVNWADADMVVVADKADGVSAFEAFLEVNPDLVVTDIRMPGMDGMELVRKIREIDEACAIILLTCLEELSLAREAMRLGVSLYLIKASMTDEEILQALMHVRALLDARKGRRQSANMHTQEMMFEEAVRSHVVYRTIPYEEFACIAGATGCVSTGQLCTVALLSTESPRISEPGRSIPQGSALNHSVKDIALEKVAALGCGCVIQIDQENLLMLAWLPSKEGNELTTLLQNIQMAYNKYFDMSVTIVVVGVSAGRDSLPNAYEQCKRLLNAKYFLGSGIIIGPDDVRRLGPVMNTALQPLLEMCGTHEDAVRHLEAMRECFSREIDFIMPSGEHQCKDLLLRVFSSMLPRLIGPCMDEVIVVNKAILTSTTLKEAIDAIMNFLRVHTSKKRSPLREDIMKAMQIMSTEYMKELTIQHIASRVGLSPNYFSSMFTQETGEHFVSCLNRIRITKAKELLNESQMYFYEIAEKTGFADETYFSRIFRRHAGMSPSEWRRGLNDEIRQASDD